MSLLSVATSHSSMVVSRLLEARVVASGEKATQVTVSVCPWSVASNPSVVAGIKGSSVSQANRLNRRAPTAISNRQSKLRLTGILHLASARSTSAASTRSTSASNSVRSAAVNVSASNLSRSSSSRCCCLHECLTSYLGTWPMITSTWWVWLSAKMGTTLPWISWPSTVMDFTPLQT
jgi:hypothetical protein